MPVESVLDLVAIAILVFMALFHFYWAAGGSVGTAVAIPQNEAGARLFEPNAMAAFGIGLALLIAALCVAGFAGEVVLPVPSALLQGGEILLAAIFTIRALGWFQYAGFFKTVRDTPFGRFDTWLYCPLCLVIGVCLSCRLVLSATFAG